MDTFLNSIIKSSTCDGGVRDIALKVADGGRITTDEALVLYQNAPLGLLGMLAFAVKESKTDRKVFFNRNFHIEPTNVCVNNCKFCSYKKPKGDAQAWELSLDEILHQVRRYKDSHATECHIVGGVHPDRDIDYYCNLIREVKNIIPDLNTIIVLLMFV